MINVDFDKVQDLPLLKADVHEISQGVVSMKL